MRPWLQAASNEASSSAEDSEASPFSDTSSNVPISPGWHQRRHFHLERLWPERRPAVQGGVKNPFVDPNGGWTCYEVFKLVLLGPTLMPLRVAVLVVCLVFAGLVARVATCGFPMQRWGPSSRCLWGSGGCVFHEKPLPRWRQKIVGLLSGIVWLMLACFGFFRVKVIDNRPPGAIEPGIVVVAPHLTDIDVLMLYWTFGTDISCFGDINILKAPFVSWVGIALQTIWVDLRSQASKEKSKEVIEARMDPVWKGHATTIFPEGRITNGSSLIQFRTGAFIPGRPILPVVLRYPHRHFDPTGQSRANRARLWPVRILTQFYNSCEVEILEPYVPGAAERVPGTGAVLLAQNVRNRMASALGVDVTDHSYDDAILFKLAMTLGVDENLIDFEMHDAKKTFQVNLDDVIQSLHRFNELDLNHDGRLDYNEFCRGYRKWKHLFDFFDADGSHVIEYREFVAGLAWLAGNCSAEDRAKLVFHNLDRDHDGQVRLNGKGPLDLNEFLKVAQTPDGAAYVDQLFSQLKDSGHQ